MTNFAISAAWIAQNEYLFSVKLPRLLYRFFPSLFILSEVAYYFTSDNKYFFFEIFTGLSEVPILYIIEKQEIYGKFIILRKLNLHLYLNPLIRLKIKLKTDSLNAFFPNLSEQSISAPHPAY